MNTDTQRLDWLDKNLDGFFESRFHVMARFDGVRAAIDKAAPVTTPPAEEPAAKPNETSGATPSSDELPGMLLFLRTGTGPDLAIKREIAEALELMVRELNAARAGETSGATPLECGEHWSVITHNEWPAIQMKGQDTPFIIFGNDTVLGERAARRWAETIAAWMNEQMRLGITVTEPRNCDAMILKRLHEAESEMTNLNLENQDLHSRLMKFKQAATRAADALYHLRAFAYKEV